jgi:hypothetical protein
MKTHDQDKEFAANKVDEQIAGLAETQDEHAGSSTLNAHIVHDLYQVYDHASFRLQLARSLEHIEQRLEVKRTQSVGANEQSTKPVQTITDIQRMEIRPKQRSTSRPRSRFVAYLAPLAAVFLVALLVGGLVLTLLATRSHRSDTGGKPEIETAAVHMGPASFLSSSVILHPGMSLLLVNDTAVPHIIKNGYWKDNGTTILLHEHGMSTSPIAFATAHETHIIGPFDTDGTYHLFDSIHPAMNLVILVEQSGSPGAGSPTPSRGVAFVHLEQKTFQPGAVNLHKGMSLLLISATPFEDHIIANGYWKNGHAVYDVARGKPIPEQVSRNLHGDSAAKLEYVDGQGMPYVYMMFQPGNSNPLIGPFTTTGTWYFFDTIHANMNLIVVVQ